MKRAAGLERGVHAVFVVALVVAATALFVGATSRATEQHSATERAILEIQAQEQALSSDVLRLRDGLMRNYDSTVERRRRIAALIAEIADGGAVAASAPSSRAYVTSPRRVLDPRIAALVADYTAAMAASDVVLERFQSRNAVLQNSLAFSATLAKDLMSASLSQPGGVELARALERALNDMFEFYVTNSSVVAGPKGHAAILRALSQRDTIETRIGIGRFVTHLEMVFARKVEVDHLVSDYLARAEPALSAQLFEVNRANLNAAGAAVRGKTTALYAVSIVLVAYVAFIILRLIQARHRLGESNATLECRVLQRTAGLQAEIAERNKTEGELRQSEARLAGILNIAPDAMILVDAELTIRLYNQGAEAAFGYTAPEAIGRNMDILIPERLRQEHADMVTAFAMSRETTRRADGRGRVVAIRKDGTEFPAAISISKMERGGETVFFVILRDVSERVQAEQAVIAAKEHAELANRAKSQFLANMSHELRTPLNAIIGFAEVIEKQTFGPVGNQRYVEYVTDIRESGEHLLSLINDILDLSKIEAGKDELYEETLDVAGLVSACLLVVRARAETAGVALSTDIPNDLPLLFGDERKLKQILINLLSNAVKFTESGGQVTVAATLDASGGISVRVADTGIGIAPHDITRALTSFQQVQSDHNRNYDGTGLGLPLTKSLIELHGGTMDLHSELAVGTTVTARFPADRVVDRKARRQANASP